MRPSGLLGAEMVERPTRGLVWLGWVHVLRVERHCGVWAEKNQVLSKGIGMVSNQLWTNEAKLKYIKKELCGFWGRTRKFHHMCKESCFQGKKTMGSGLGNTQWVGLITLHHPSITLKKRWMVKRSECALSRQRQVVALRLTLHWRRRSCRGTHLQTGSNYFPSYESCYTGWIIKTR